MTREDPQMKIRLTDDLKKSIERAAHESGRSMNAEIVARLQKSFESPGDETAVDKLAVAVITLKLVQRLVDDADLQSNISDMLKFITGADARDNEGAADTLENLVKKNTTKIKSAAEKEVK